MRAYQSVTFCSETIRHSTGNCSLSLSRTSVGARKSFLAVLTPSPGRSFIAAAVLLFFLQSFSETVIMMSVKCRLK